MTRLLRPAFGAGLSLVMVAALAATGSVQASDTPDPDLEPDPAAVESVDDLPLFVDEADVEVPTPDLSIDRWDSMWGQSLGDVPHGASPTQSADVFGEFESPVDVGDQYGVRMRTLLTPEASGTYRFWIAGDDDMRLFMNTAGDDPAGAHRIAYVAGWTDYRQFDRFASQRSEWIDLEAGRPYYLEAIGKEGSGGDHFTVAWERLDGQARTVIPGDVLEATQLGSGGWRAATPIGLPGTPDPLTDPGWTYSTGPETLTLGWNAVDGAEWYEIRLEGAGQAVDIEVEDAFVAFDDLVPDTRYLVEVAPASAAGRQPATARVLVTEGGPYPTPVTPPAGDEPTVTYDRWDTGWWTLTSVPAGLEPLSTNTLSTGLETPPMQGEHHAARVRATVTPEVSGSYRLHLSADDDARLLFNSRGPWAHGAERVAYVSGWSEQYQWDRYRSQTTDEFELVAGREYYVEAFGVHAFGLDHLEVGWSRDGGPIEVVPADVLAPTMSGAGGWRQDASELAVAPGPVVDVTHEWTSASNAVVEWSAPSVTDEFGIATHYVVSFSDGDTSETFTADEPFATLDGLAPGVEYELDIAAANHVGSGPSVGTLLYGDLVAARDWIATGTSRCAGLEVSASRVNLNGQLRSNEQVGLFVGDVLGDGLVSYGDAVRAGSFDLGGGYVFEDDVETANPAVSFEQLFAGDVPDVAVFVHAGKLKSKDMLAPGLHIVNGDVNLSSDATDLSDVTVVATGKIKVSGSSIVVGSAADGLPGLWSASDSCGQAIKLSGWSIVAHAEVHAPFGLLRFNGSELTTYAHIAAASIRVSASSVGIGGSSDQPAGDEQDSDKSDEDDDRSDKDDKDDDKSDKDDKDKSDKDDDEADDDKDDEKDDDEDGSSERMLRRFEAVTVDDDHESIVFLTDGQRLRLEGASRSVRDAFRSA